MLINKLMNESNTNLNKSIYSTLVLDKNILLSKLRKRYC